MKLTISLFSLLLIMSLSSCVQESDRSTTPKEVEPEIPTVTPEEPEEPQVEVDPEPGTTPTVDIAVYVEYPEEIDGCACYFGRNAAELSDAKYIFMTNYEKRAYMKLDGEMRVFDLISSTDLEDGRLMETWKNADYDMVVKSQETGSIDETWQNIGTINIKPKDKGATMIDVVGECGC